MMDSIICYVVKEIKLHCNMRLESGKRASKQQATRGEQAANSDVIGSNPGPVLSLEQPTSQAPSCSAIAEEAHN
jgi:hypothetical protein